MYFVFDNIYSFLLMLLYSRQRDSERATLTTGGMRKYVMMRACDLSKHFKGFCLGFCQFALLYYYYYF